MNKNEKKQFSKLNKTKQHLEDLKETMTGFLIFTNKNKEKNSIKDAYNILNEIIEELYPNLFQEEKIENEKVNTNIDKLDNELNKIKNTKKFFNKEEPMAANKIINKYKKYLKEFEIEELKHIYKKGELVYYLGEILERINNKDYTFSKINQSFILKNKNKINFDENISLKLGNKKNDKEEKIFLNRSSNNFHELNKGKLQKIKKKFDLEHLG